MKNTLEIDGTRLAMNVGTVTDGVQFTFTCAGENNDAEPRRIAYANVLGQRRDGQPLILDIDDTFVTEVGDDPDKIVSWPAVGDDSGEYAPSGTLTKRTIPPGDTGDSTFKCKIVGKGRVYLYFLIRYTYGPNHTPIQMVEAAMVEVV